MSQNNLSYVALCCKTM